MRRNPALAVVALAATASLFLAACGEDATDGAAGNGATTTTVAPTNVAPADETIVDVAVASGDFTTLVAAVQAAGLAETLSGPGPFTVFAPTDEAFAAIPPATLESLLEPANRQTLTDILTYHVLAAEVLAADVEPGTVQTVEGSDLTVEVGADGSVVLIDGQGNRVSVVATDVMADNGVIHVIDGVLLPAGVTL